MKTVHEIIEHTLKVEGEKYTNDPKDSGGPTKWGWTEKALRDMGWNGDVRNLDRATAYDLYYARFVVNSGYQPIMALSAQIVAELVDTAVNMGEARAGRFLQMCLNAFNNEQKLYPDITEDGIVGKRTVATLQTYLKHRGSEGELVMLRALNSLQGAYYLELSRSRPKDERFVYGWILNRVVI